MHGRHFAEAAAVYKRAVCLFPDSARGWYGLARAQAASNDFLNARESFQTSDRLLPGSPMPLVMQVRMNFALHDMDALKANLRNLALRFPGDAQTHQTLSRFLAEQDLLVLALAEALRAEQASPGDPAAKLQFAALANTAGAYDDAIRSALAISADPAAPSALRAAAAGIAGLSYESLGKPEQAVQYLKQALELDPSRDNSYLALADLYDQMHRYPEEVAVLTQAKANVPESASVLLPLGMALLHAERYRESSDTLHALLKQAPEVEQAYLGLADAARKTGNPAQEIVALQALERRKPDYPMIHLLIARAFLNKARPEYTQVLRELTLAEKQSPLDAEVFYLRGRVYAAQGQFAQAVPALSRAIELRPLDASPYYQLARVYQKLGKPALAQQQFGRLRYLQTANVKDEPEPPAAAR